MSDKINELINHLEEENVIGFGETLNDILLTRISEAIKLKVEEVGAAVYSNPEQIDELSKKTLGSYIKKASSNIDKNSWDSGYHARYPSELSPDSRDAELRISQKAIGKSAKRVKGIAKATDKLTKEDVDIDFDLDLSDIDFEAELGE